MQPLCRSPSEQQQQQKPGVLWGTSALVPNIHSIDLSGDRSFSKNWLGNFVLELNVVLALQSFSGGFENISLSVWQCGCVYVCVWGWSEWHRCRDQELEGQWYCFQSLISLNMCKLSWHPQNTVEFGGLQVCVVLYTWLWASAKDSELGLDIVPNCSCVRLWFKFLLKNSCLHVSRLYHFPKS